MTLRRGLAIVGPATAGLGLSLAFWGRLPERIPIHWDDHGEADGFAPKTIALLLLPVVGALVGALTSWAIRKGNAPRAADALALTFGAFHLALHGMMIHAALSTSHRISMGVLVVLMGALFGALGLAMPHLEQNQWAGVRTPWSMRDEVNWKLTHRFAGWSMGISGLVAIVAGLALDVPMSFWAGFASVMIGSFLPVGYSYVVERMRRRPSRV